MRPFLPCFSLKRLRHALAVLLALAAICSGAPSHATPGAETAAIAKIRVLASTFPMYLFALNITRGSKMVELQPLLPPHLGCPHDYALTPQDMRKLANAQVLIVNGMGLEEFLGDPLRQANPNLTIIDSAGFAEGEILPGMSEPNPHLFSSPGGAAVQVQRIALGLGRLAPDEQALFTRNAEAYLARLAALQEEIKALAPRLAARKIVVQHGAFDYLAHDLHLEIVSVLAGHPGADPSAAEVLALLKKIRAGQAVALFTEPQYPDKLARTVAKESGLKLATLDPVASGPENPALDYYEKTMRQNLKTLAEILETQ